MSCCGCASRVLKLQSELRSWKTKLGDEKREKKMILKWISAVFGYDVKVEIEKETRTVRLQATENKEAMSKAIIKSGLSGNEEDCGVMVMEVKLEDQEYFEPFEDPFETPEFPILEINSMPTSNQIPPLVSTGITGYGNLSQFNPQTLSITTPMEVAATPLPVLAPNDQEVLYIAGNLEEGTTLEGPNGQSYIIVGANDATAQTLPLQMEYSAVAVNDSANVIVDSNNMMLPSVLPGQETVNALNFLTAAQSKPPILPLVTSLPLPAVIKTDALVTVPPPPVGVPVPEPLIDVNQSYTPINNVKPSASSKKKTSLSSFSASKSMKSKKKSGGNDADSDLKIKNMTGKTSSASQRAMKTSETTKPDIPSVAGLNLNSSMDVGNGNQPQAMIIANGGIYPLTTSTTDLFILQKARAAIEKLSNGFYKCTVCNVNCSLYSNYDIALTHAKTHYDVSNKIYKCDFCDELFGKQKELVTHCKSVHSQLKGAAATKLKKDSALRHNKPPSKPKPKVATLAKTKNSPKSTTSSSSPSSIPVLQFTSNASSFSGTTTTTITGSTSSSNSTSLLLNSSIKTVKVQEGFDKKLISGPISVSSEMLAAILGGTVTVAFSSS